MAGVESSGFVLKSLTEIKAELEEAFRQAFGASIDVSPQSVFGQIIGITSEREADIWAMAQDVYTAFTSDGATGTSLDNIAGLTGTLRLASFPSTVTLYVTGTNATSLSIGRIASVTGTGTRFETLAGVTLSTATAWAISTVYSLGDVRRNGATQRCYLCTVAGTSAGSGGPDSTAAAITDGTVTWRYLGDGAAFASVAAQSIDDGPKVAAAGTLTTIETPVAGWSGVTNPLDAALGADEETDAALRVRRESELRGAGSATVGALQTSVARVENVASVTVFENPEDVTDIYGIPPHSVEVLVQGGADADIRQAIFENVAAGIRSYGTTTGAVTDSRGVSHPINFSRLTEIDIYAALSVTVDVGAWPTDGAAQLQQAITDYGDAQRAGKNVVASSLIAQAFTIPGVLDASALISTAPSPTLSTTISISPREIAVFDTSRISVTVTAGVP